MRTEWEHSGWMIDFSAEEWSKTSLKLVGFLEWAWLFSSPQISFRLEVRPLERSPQKLRILACLNIPNHDVYLTSLSCWNT